MKNKICLTLLISFCKRVKGFGIGAGAVGGRYFAFIQVFDICLT